MTVVQGRIKGAYPTRSREPHGKTPRVPSFRGIHAMVRKTDKIPEDALCRQIPFLKINVKKELHNTIRNDPNYGGKVVAAKIDTSYQRYVYILKDGSKVIIAHSRDALYNPQIMISPVT